MPPTWPGLLARSYEKLLREEGLDAEILPNHGGAAALLGVMSRQIAFSSANFNILHVAADGGLEPRILLREMVEKFVAA